MRVGEIKEIASEADVYELRPDCKYLIVVRRDRVSGSTANALVEALAPGCVVLSVPDTEQAVRVLSGEGIRDVDLSLRAVAHG